MSLFDGNTLMQLQKLLRDPDEEVDSDGEDCGPPRRGGVDQLGEWEVKMNAFEYSSDWFTGPGDIGPKKQSKKSAKLDAETAARRERYAPIKKTEEKRPATMEEWEEMQEKENNEIIETRKRPKYTVLYKQAVKTEDIYLQVNRKCLFHYLPLHFFVHPIPNHSHFSVAM